MTSQDQQTVNLALGRIFGMMQRPERDGDVSEYERCRRLILNIVEVEPGYRPYVAPHDYARDRLKGAQGD